jgi:hypothetical protein
VATPVWKATRSIGLKKPGSREEGLLISEDLTYRKSESKPRGVAAA